ERYWVLSRVNDKRPSWRREGRSFPKRRFAVELPAHSVKALPRGLRNGMIRLKRPRVLRRIVVCVRDFPLRQDHVPKQRSTQDLMSLRPVHLANEAIQILAGVGPRPGTDGDTARRPQPPQKRTCSVALRAGPCRHVSQPFLASGSGYVQHQPACEKLPAAEF